MDGGHSTWETKANVARRVTSLFLVTLRNQVWPSTLMTSVTNGPRIETIALNGWTDETIDCQNHHYPTPCSQISL